MGIAFEGKQRKAKKGRRNHDEDTGMFAFPFLTITSVPATHHLSLSLGFLDLPKVFLVFCHL